MLILIALTVHALGHYLFLKIIDKNKADVRYNTGLKGQRIWFEASGTIANLLSVVIILFFLSIFAKEKILLNQDAIYGIECSEFAKEFGFKDGDKILSINGKASELFSDNLPLILTDKELTKIVLQRDQSQKIILIDSIERIRLLKNMRQFYLYPKQDKNATPLKYTERQIGIKKTLNIYWNTWVEVKIILSKNSNEIGSVFSFTSYNWQTYLFWFAFSSSLIACINMIPLPGLDIGNILLFLIEQKNKRSFSAKKVRILKALGISIIVIIGLLCIL